MSDVPTAVVNNAVNDALREAYNTVGDEAYFLRRTMTVTLSEPPLATELPVAIRRLARLERIQFPGMDIPWSLVSTSTTGQLSIVAQEGGNFTAHYLDYPSELVTDDDVSPLPPQHAELVVVMACRRLAQSVGNASVAAILEREVAVLSKVFRRDCQRYNGQRHEALHTYASRSTWAAGPPTEWNP